MKTCPHCGKELNAMILVPELGIKIESAVHSHGTVFKDIKIPKGMRLLNVEEAIYVANDDNLCKQLDLKSETNDFFIEQPFKTNKDRAASLNYVNGRFHIYGSDDLNYADGRSRGVLFCKEIDTFNEEKEE